MLINSVILVLQETLEAALLISLMLTISRLQWEKVGWVPVSLAAGLILSVLYASQMAAVSEWFDYVGQEIVNATLLTSITLMIAVCVWAMVKDRNPTVTTPVKTQRLATMFTLSAGLAVALAITREGAEIFIYLSGFIHQDDYFQTVITGSLIGFGIGTSIGVLLFYGLHYLPQKWRLSVPLILLALFAGNMMAQAAVQLTQADWAPSTQILWDTSELIPETSLSGQLLYALIGYEATPSMLQVLSYIGGVILIIAFGVIGNRSQK